MEEPSKGTILKWIGIVVAVLIGLTVLANALGIANIYWSAEKAKITAKPRVISKIYETENIIVEVAKFHDECTAVQRELAVFQNNYGRYQADKEAAADASTGLEKEAAVQSLPNDVSDYTAPLNSAQAEAAAYNSNSAQYTQNEFKTHNLPNRIDLPPGPPAAAKFQLNCH